VQRVLGRTNLPATNANVEDNSATTVGSAAAPVALRTSVATERVASSSPVITDVATAVGETRPIFAVTESLQAAPASVSRHSSRSTAVEGIDQFPEFDDAPEVHTLADLVGSNPLRLTRASAFLAANIAAGLAFMLARSVLLAGTLHPVYWQFAVLRGIAVTLATVLAFRFVRRGWVAAAVAAAGTVVLILPVYHFTLGTFNLADLFYREQFQEFLLIPFVDVLAMLLGLFFIIPRVRPLALALWLGPLCAEISTSMLITLLRDLGSGSPPDPILVGTLVFFLGVRSLVFAAVFWSGLKLAGIGRAATQ
jgi:hypothetical protein